VPIDGSAVKAAHFTLTESGEFAPTPLAQSHWGDDHLNGPAVVGLAARSLELLCGSADFMPARLTVELFRAARGVSTALTVRVVRDGRRIRSAECELAQQGRSVARATLLQYRRSVASPGRLWAAPMSLPPLPSVDGAALTQVGSEGRALSWSPGEHQNDSRWASDGVAVGTATLFDQDGAFGSGMTTAVSNPAAQIDFANDPFPLRIG